MGRLRTEDDGRITLLSLGFGVLLLALVLVVAAATSIHIERKRLLSLADSVAARAADAIDEELYYRGDGLSAGVPLSDASVRAAVEDHLAQSAITGRFRGLAIIDPTGAEGARTAVVSLRARARPAVVPWVLAPWSDGIDIRVTSRGRAQ